MTWVYVNTKLYCVALDTEGGVISYAPPILKWAEGKSAAWLKDVLMRRGILREWKEFEEVKGNIT